MRKYTIGVREVHVQLVEVLAETEDEAFAKIREGDGDYLDDSLEFSHTMDHEHFSVEHVSNVLLGFKITHRHRHGGLEDTTWWAQDGAHAYEQWNDYAKELGAEFHAMVRIPGEKEV